MLKTKEQIIEELIAAGKEIAPDDPAQRTAGRRVSSIDGVHCYFSAEEETARDAEEAAVAAEQADYVANHKYKDDRKEAYAPIGDQLDALWKQLNQDRLGGKNLIQEADDQLNAVLAVKAAHPKPT
jgi:uncharacterized protein YciI